jgi:hypothetical protein
MPINRRYRELLALHERTLKYLQSIEFDPELLDTYRTVLHHLRTRTDEQIHSILELGTRQKVQKRETATDDPADIAIERMTLDQVREHVTRESTSRRLLERIAAIRFGVTRGAISSAKSRDALIEKITTLVRNEDTHGSITRAVESRNRNP